MNGPNSYVLDASAVLAVLYQERGADQVRKLVPAAVISSVNAAEVLAKLVLRGFTADEALASFGALDLTQVPFGPVEVSLSVRFVDPKLSLGDRACLATAAARGERAVTADRNWQKTRVKVDAIYIR